MSDKPSYLGLLNALALGESRAHQYFSAWIDKTPDPDVKAVLTTVCWREGEHGMIFAKRLDELGYSVLDRPDPRAEEAMCIASSDMTDLEKFEKLGLATSEDTFASLFNDTTIDPRTGELLGRYISEERDTLRMFKCCYEELSARRDAELSGSVSATSLDSKVDELCQAVGELRELVGTLAAAAPSDAARRSTKGK
jgi:rubrerythrin